MARDEGLLAGAMDIFLETPRLTLRRLTLDDAEALYQLDSDPEVMRYLSGGPGTPLEMIRDDILPRFIRSFDHARWAGAWAIEERDSGEFAGWLSLRPSDDLARGAELGYRLRRESWGRGFATEAAKALLDCAFAEHGLTRVFGTTYEHNLGSRRVMEKLGMRHTRSFRFAAETAPPPATFAAADGPAWDGDDVEYALERFEWEALERRPG